MFKRTSEKTLEFTQITFTVFLVVGVPLLYAIWFQLFWLNFWWGADFGLAMIAVLLCTVNDSAYCEEED